MIKHNISRSQKHYTALNLFFALLIIVFIADILTNFVVNTLNLTILAESIIDGFLILLIAFPALYFFIFRPLSLEIMECRRAEKVKDDFISTVSHELRTPLSITKEGLSLVLDKIPGPINEQQARILTVSKNNIDRLARIINSLLDISKISSGKVCMTCGNIEMTAVIRQVVALFEFKTYEKGLELRTNLPHKEIMVYADLDGVTQILTNLMGNALKFTEKGYIEVSLVDKDAEIEITVADTGAGISKENMPKLFEKFQQFDRVDGPGERGTGLGLAIVKGLVTAHKGRIWAESEPSKGTKFIFTVPKKRKETV